MKIAVCIKQVVDINSAINLSHNGSGLVEDKLGYIVNPADECAVEEALRIKESLPETEIILLSAGPPRVEQVLRHCLAMGANRAIRLWDSALAEMDALVCARVLAKFIATMGVDLIFCGCRSLDLAEGQIPIMLAELLDLPLVNPVTKLELSDEGTYAILHRKLQKGDLEVIKCSLPALFAVEPEINTPRYPNLRQILESQKTLIEKPELIDQIPDDGAVDIFSSLTKVIALTPPRPKPKRTVILDILATDTTLSAEDRLNLVLNYGMRQKDNDLWQGSTEELSQRLVNFIKQEGFL